MRLLLAFCLVALLAFASGAPALERVRRQTSVDVDVNRQGDRTVGTVGVSRDTPLGTLRGTGTFGQGKPIWGGELTRQWGNNNLNLNAQHQGGRTQFGAGLTHRSDRFGDFGARANFGNGERGFGVTWSKRFRRAAAEHYAALMELLDEE